MTTARINTNSSHSGFTLVELVVTIVVSTIVVGFIALFITTPIDTYTAQARRGELVIEADLIKRNIDNDVRYAVPNSIRSINTGTTSILEMLYSIDMGRYPATGTVIPATESLDIGTPDNAFSTFGKFNRGASSVCPPGSRLVIGQDQSFANTNAYAGAQVITPSTSTLVCNSVVGKSNVTITPAFNFLAGSPTRHVFVVSGLIAYVCDKTAHTLKRYFGYQIAIGIAANRNAAPIIGLVSQDIKNCNFNYSNSTSVRGDLVSSNFQLQRSGEMLTSMVQSTVENTP